MTRGIKRKLLFLVVALAIVFVLQNAAPVRTSFFFATLEMPRALLILVSFLLGGVAGYLASATGLFSRGERRARPGRSEPDAPSA
jgi:uncharacterized integral membrane protein